jgi:multimeric flavodoxin WrbA
MRRCEQKGTEYAMRILVLNGSPKKKSDTFRMTEAFLRGMDKEQENVIDVINVIEKNIAPCKGCFGCWQKKDGHCVIQDDQNEILDLYVKADVIIWSFPLYCYSMPSHLKAVLDRTIPLVKKGMVEESNGTIHHEALVDFSKIHTVVISGCGFPNWEGNFDALKQMCNTCFGNLEMVCVPEAPLFNIPEAAIVAEPLLESFEKAGAEFASNLELSDETKKILETPMISKEEYLKGING